MHYEHRDLMAGLDQFWRCFAHTFFYNFFVPFLQVFRLIYGFITPLVNLVLVTWWQIWRGIPQIFLKCQVQSIFEPVEHFVVAIVKLALSFVQFLGFTPSQLPVSTQNNIAVNDWNTVPGLTEVFSGLNSTQIGVRCACSAMDPVWDLIFAPLTSSHLPRAIDHWFNVLVRLVQIGLRIIVPPGEFPNPERILYHVYGGILETAFFMDHIIYTVIINIVRIFSGGQWSEEALRTPKEFIVSVFARIGLTFIQIPVNLVFGIFKFFEGAVTSGGSAHMMNAFNMDDVWANLYISLYDQSNTLHWALYLIENIVGGLFAAQNVNSFPLPTTFECNWVDDYAPENIMRWPKAPHMISYTVACVWYNTGLTLLGGALVPSELMKELFFKSIILWEQNMLRVFQKYDGMWSSREEISTCEKRRERASPLNGTMRLDWTIDPDRCNCDMQLGNYVAPDPNFYPPPADYRYESKPVYNPWCGQPTFQDQIFAPMEATVIYFTRGIFGPTGIGEVFQYYSGTTPDVVLQGSAEEAEPIEIDSMTLPPVNRMVIELMRVVMRLLLSFPDMVIARWVYYDINCGYGLNTTHLEFRYAMLNGMEWNATSLTWTKNNVTVLMPTDDETLRWEPCQLRQFRFPGIFFADNTDMKTCVETNEDDSCSCNFMLNLTIDSPCGCIANLPELNTIADDNPIANYYAYKQITAASYRWCNSNYLEWFFFMQNQMLDALAYLIAMGPWNTDCVAARAITEETSFSSYYVVAALTTTDTNDSGDIALAEKMCDAGGKDVFAELVERVPNIKEILGDKCDNVGGISTSRGTCKLWSNDNFFCSLSMILRTLGAGLISLQRQIHNNIIMILAGNWNDLPLDLRHRICDMEKVFAAMIGAFTNVITVGGARGVKKAIGKLLIIQLQFPLVMLKLGNVIVQFLFSMINELKKAAAGQISSSSIQSNLNAHVEKLAKEVVRMFLDILILFCDAMGDFWEVISSGAGDFFYGISDAITMLGDMLAGVLFDILAVVLDVLFQMLALFSGTGKVGDFLTAAWGFISKLLAVFLQNITRVIAALFSMLGPAIGGFLTALMDGFCHAINGIICGLTFGGECSLMSCLSGGFGNAESQPLGSNFHGYRSKYGQHDLPRLFKQHYHTVDGIPAPKWVAENLDWNGTSVCDLFMEGVKFYNYTEMRPLERATWLSCLEQRAIGQELDRLIGIPELKVYDILYNYHRKWHIGLQTIQVYTVAFSIYLNTGSVTDAKLRHGLIEANVIPDGPIQIYNKVLRTAIWMYDSFKIDMILDDLFSAFDPDYTSEGRPTLTAKIYKTGSDLKDTATKFSNEWKSKKLTKKGWVVFDTLHKATTDEGWLKSTFTSSYHLQATGHLIRQFIDKSGEHVRLSRKPGRIFKQEKSRLGNPYKLQKPVNSNISFPDTYSILCPDPESPACVQCTILDNLFEIVRDWANAMGRFQSTVYAAPYQPPDPHTGFVKPGTLNDIGLYFIHMFTNNSGFIDTTQQLTRSKRRLHRTFHPYTKKIRSKKLHSTAAYNSTIAPITARWPRVARDWGELFGNLSTLNTSSPEFASVNTKLVRGLKMLLSETDHKYVPFFGFGIPYAISFIFTESCNVKTAVWNEGTSQSERLSSIDKALWACFWFTLALLTNGMWSVVPLGFVVNIMVLANLNKLLFFWIVYGYLPSCEPTWPHMLFEDLVEWIAKRIAPGCFCESWPVLTAAWCAPSTCYQCGIAAGQYINCNDELPFAKEWGVWWWFPMLIRWVSPGSISWLAETGVVQEGDATFQNLVFDAFQNPNATTTLMKECVWVTSGDLFVNGVVAAIAGYIIFQITLVIFKFLIDFFLMLWQIFLLFQWTALAIEQTTRVSADETDDTDEIFSG